MIKQSCKWDRIDVNSANSVKIIFAVFKAF